MFGDAFHSDQCLMFKVLGTYKGWCHLELFAKKQSVVAWLCQEQFEQRTPRKETLQHLNFRMIR